jgi:hypothetical protein
MDWIITVAGGGLMGTHFFASSLYAMYWLSLRYFITKSRCPVPPSAGWQIQTFGRFVFFESTGLNRFHVFDVILLHFLYAHFAPLSH